MGKRLANWIKIKRAARSKHPIAVSPFTIFLLGFGLSYWFFHFYTTTLMVGCEYPLSWLDGWESFWSPFQIVGLAIVLCAVVWLLRLFDCKNLNRLETVFQFVFILGLCGAFLAQKAYFFPYATPSQAQVARVVSVFYDRVRLSEEHELINEYDVRDNWSYDYPPPPLARKPEWPGYDNDLHLPPEEIFLSKDSPTYADFKRLHVCYENYRNAQVQYERDMETWENYWEGFSKNIPEARGVPGDSRAAAGRSIRPNRNPWIKFHHFSFGRIRLSGWRDLRASHGVKMVRAENVKWRQIALQPSKDVSENWRERAKNGNCFTGRPSSPVYGGSTGEAGDGGGPLRHPELSLGLTPPPQAGEEKKGGAYISSSSRTNAAFS